MITYIVFQFVVSSVEVDIDQVTLIRDLQRVIVSASFLQHTLSIFICSVSYSIFTRVVRIIEIFNSSFDWYAIQYSPRGECNIPTFLSVQNVPVVMITRLILFQK